MLRRSAFLLMLALVVTPACGGGDDPPTTPTPAPPQGPATLQIVDVTVGEGAEATGTKLLVMHYTLYAYDPAGPDGRGTRLQGSRDFGRTLDFRQNTNAVITGFDQGVLGMRAGGVRRVTIPPSLAYGSTGNSLVAPNAWIVFDLELISVTD